MLSYQELAQAQSDAAIELVRSGMPAEISRELDDEHPVIPLAADVHDDVAMTALLSWTDQDHGREELVRICTCYCPVMQPGR